ncbi:MAG: hypothetical protein GDA51_11705 [Ekhidna sp.]|nr:hypothetical protein [Ekhidna sp.]MBC6409130.1 hypothetical protein [Ekhidna sp.]MBC6427099.1 hypothetical protein [Ekhidna sp.]
MLIRKELFSLRFFRGVHLVIRLKRNMKSQAITPVMEAILLRKRAICETIMGQLKHIFQVEHRTQKSGRLLQ